MPAPRSTLYRLADQRLDGQLAERLRDLRADDRSWRYIADKLAEDLGFQPSYETVRAWGLAVGADEPTASAVG